MRSADLMGEGEFRMVGIRSFIRFKAIMPQSITANDGSADFFLGVREFL
jgi:hypothetical protein